MFLPRGGTEAKGDWLNVLLASRGLHTPVQREAFLRPDMAALRDAELLPGAQEAAKVLEKIRRDRHTVAIYGDYDVDGVCAAAIMEETLIAYGVDCFIYIPDRHEEGYGLNMEAVERLSERAQCIWTVDCGIVSHGEVERARELNMDVVITDHHRPGDTLPRANAVVCPLLEDYPFPYLCGAGVAWKMCDLLMGRDFAMGRLCLCALATVADVVSLTDENRVLVYHGLKQIASTARPGLISLCRRAGLETGSVTSSSIAYQLAPRLNAAGRLESAMDAVRLLRTEDEGEAEALSLKLELLNTKRREAQSVVMAEAEDQVREMDLTALHAIVVLGENWDSGVVGLAAGKIAEKYAYPTVILTRLEDGETCVGSARSAGQVDIHRALHACGDIFLRFGGHAAAAGMTLKCEDVPLLRERLSQNVSEQLQGKAPVKTVVYDAKMTLAEVTQHTVEQLEALEPFGMGNPAPRFLFENAEMLLLRRVGAQRNHLKCTLRQDGQVREGIAFGLGHLDAFAGNRADLVAVPVLNRFMGRVTAECQVTDLKPSCAHLPRDEERELRAVLQELRLLAENMYEFAPIAGFSAVEDVPETWLCEPQGTLFWCRRAETAERMAARYPQLSLLENPEGDPRAYTGIALYQSAFSPRYKRVVLCDGLLCNEEMSYLRAVYPGTEFVYFSGSSAREMAIRLRVSVEELRDIYRALRASGGDEIARFAERMHIPAARADAAFDMLSDMKLIRRRQGPDRAEMLPAQKSDPEMSALYRLLSRIGTQEGVF